MCLFSVWYCIFHVLFWHALCSGRQGRRRNVWVYLLSTGCLCLMLFTVRKLTRAMLSVVILNCCVPARCCDCLRVTYVSRRAVSVYCLKPSLQSTIWCEGCLSVIHVAWCSLIMFPVCARFINEYVSSLCTFHCGICLVIASLPNTKLWGRCVSWVYVS